MKNLPSPLTLPALRVVQAVNLGGMTESAFHIQDPEANAIWATCKGDRWTKESEARRRAELLASLPEVTAERARLRDDVAELRTVAEAYRNLLRTMASTEGECATFRHIEAVLEKTNPKA